jgi:hypothetical protein
MSQPSRTQDDASEKQVLETQGGHVQGLDKNDQAIAATYPSQSGQMKAEKSKAAPYTRTLMDITSEFKNAVRGTQLLLVSSQLVVGHFAN